VPGAEGFMTDEEDERIVSGELQTADQSRTLLNSSQFNNEFPGLDKK